MGAGCIFIKTDRTPEFPLCSGCFHSFFPPLSPLPSPSLFLGI